MAVHLIKLAVGIESVDHLAQVQAHRRALSQVDGVDRLFATTRSMPRRAEEVIDGGSLFWVVKGVIRVRQRVQDLEAVTDTDGTGRCLIHLDPVLVRTAPVPTRPFQGWRYLDAAKAQIDLDDRDDAGGFDPDMPPEMLETLRTIGVL